MTSFVDAPKLLIGKIPSHLHPPGGRWLEKEIESRRGVHQLRLATRAIAAVRRYGSSWYSAPIMGISRRKIGCAIANLCVESF
jgi:hypothetical protein